MRRVVGRLLEIGVWACLGSVVAYWPILTDAPPPGFGVGLALIAGRVALFVIVGLTFVALRFVAHPGAVHGALFGGSSVALGAVSTAIGLLAIHSRALIEPSVPRYVVGASPEVAVGLGSAGILAGLWLLTNRRLSGIVASVGTAAGAAGLWVLEMDNLSPWVATVLGPQARTPEFLLPSLALLLVAVAAALTPVRPSAREHGIG